MSNQEQLAILKQGTKVWNQWREDRLLEVIPAFTKVDISRADLNWAKTRKNQLTWR